MRILEEYDQLDSQRTHQVFRELLEAYLNPAFGSMSKRDLDISLFMKLQELELIGKNPDLYDIVTDLRVTRAKARNFLYESKLRKTTQHELNTELKELLIQPIFLKDDDKIVMEVANPFLVDHIRSKLKKLGHITDGSFSPELIKLRPEAFSALFLACLPESSKSVMTKAFIDCGAKSDTSLKHIFISMLKKIASRVAGKAGEEALDSLSDYLKPIVEERFEVIVEKYSPLLKKTGPTLI
jgi:hypothetical protein